MKTQSCLRQSMQTIGTQGRGTCMQYLFFFRSVDHISWYRYLVSHITFPLQVMHNDGNLIQGVAEGQDEATFRSDWIANGSNYVEVTLNSDAHPTDPGKLNIENTYNFGVQSPGARLSLASLALALALPCVRARARVCGRVGVRTCSCSTLLILVYLSRFLL